MLTRESARDDRVILQGLGVGEPTCNRTENLGMSLQSLKMCHGTICTSCTWVVFVHPEHNRGSVSGFKVTCRVQWTYGLLFTVSGYHKEFKAQLGGLGGLGFVIWGLWLRGFRGLVFLEAGGGCDPLFSPKVVLIRSEVPPGQ